MNLVKSSIDSGLVKPLANAHKVAAPVAAPADVFAVCSRIGYLPGSIIDGLVYAPRDEAGKHELARAAAYAAVFCRRAPRPSRERRSPEIKAAILQFADSAAQTGDAAYRHCAPEILRLIAELLVPSRLNAAAFLPVKTIQERILKLFAALVEAWSIEDLYAREVKAADGSVLAALWTYPDLVAPRSTGRKKESWQI